MRQKCGETKQILVVDDLPENAKLLRSFLEPRGFAVQASLTGEEALATVAESPPDVILLDLMLPGMQGHEVCQRLKNAESTRHIPVIIITGLSDRQAHIEAVQAGADDFLVKPFDQVLLEARIHACLKSKILQDELLSYQEELQRLVDERTEQVQLTQEVTVFSLAKLAESRDNETGAHLERMRLYTRELALELQSHPKHQTEITNDFIKALFRSSPLHDIGKVGIPDQILLKPGKLTPEEFDIMKSHALIGGDTLRAADLEAGQDSFLAMGRDIAYHHHEKWNGKGYPLGLAGEEIPLAARIVALADVYDALTTKRPYKNAFTHEKSRDIILEGKGTHFDPDIVNAFMARENRFIEIHDSFDDAETLAPLQEILQRLEDHRQAV